jgi:hypothetical protein
MPIGHSPYPLGVNPRVRPNPLEYQENPRGKYGHKKWAHPLPHPQPFRVTLKGLGLCPMGIGPFIKEGLPSIYKGVRGVTLKGSFFRGGPIFCDHISPLGLGLTLGFTPRG